MNLFDFENQSKSAIKTVVYHLELAQFRAAQAVFHVEEAGKAVENLSHLIEDFTNQQKLNRD